MTIDTRQYLSKMIEDLLVIAKVAMPPDLFLVDPRVKRAKAYLVALGRPSPARPPNTIDGLEKILSELKELRQIDARAMVLDWDLVDPLLEARDHGLSEEDNAALNFIVRDWLIAHGYVATVGEGPD